MIQVKKQNLLLGLLLLTPGVTCFRMK